ncbi:MAG: PilC/PilY family type IV pilus protein [Lautropia sp.]|nr:PilC/PilY family type IV pilus protein [Lautropia sp.]
MIPFKQQRSDRAFAPRSIGLHVQRALFLVSCAATASATHAGIAQQSLIVKDPIAVEPNIIFTLDDSGSMAYNFVPDEDLGSESFAFHPKEPRRYYFHAQGVLATTDNNVLGARRRAYKINQIYYNPEILYRPWVNPDFRPGVDPETSRYLANADPKAAYFHLGFPSVEELRRLVPNQTVRDGGFQENGKYIRNLRVDLTGVQPRGDLEICRESQPSASAAGRSCPDDTSIRSIMPATWYEFIGPENPTEADKNNIAYYRRYSIHEMAEGSTVQRGKERTDCARGSDANTRLCTKAQEYQNFANWYQYHRTRMHVAIAAVGQAFMTLPEEVRVGYGRINNTYNNDIDGKRHTVIERGVRSFKGKDRKDFFSWLNGNIGSGATPLLNATNVVGKYFEREDDGGPWSNDPAKRSKSKPLSCRRSYHVLMTDGQYNDQDPTRFNLEADNVIGPVITGPDGQTFQYKPERPFASATKGTLADYAMHFWNRDLQPKLTNDVSDSSSPAFWQHLTMYTLSFGVEGSLSAPEDLEAIKAGTKSWPSTIEPNSAQTIDDLWHAAVNTRGEYVNVRDGTGFMSQIQRMLEAILGRKGSTAGVTVNSQALQAGNIKFVPSFVTKQWTGNLEAYELDADGAEVDKLWDANEKLPDPALRRLFVGTGEATGARSASFNWGNHLPSALRTSLLTSAGLNASQGALLIDYLRGDKTQDAALFRGREIRSRIGHIVNSPPVYVGAEIDRGYRFLPETLGGKNTGASAYKKYLSRKKAGTTRPGTVFIGSNDGILHAFDAKTGVETYGFIPHAVASEMARSSRKDYSVRFLMDGPLIERDAYWDNEWHNVLVGTTGAGPRSVFALNVDDTRQDSLDQNTVLWELDAIKQPELGHVLAAPEVGITRDGRWVAVFGNGYESKSFRAQLFVVDLKTGDVLARLDADKGKQRSATRPNGLGGVTLVRDGNQVITAAYAGDLQGNLWKFDLSSERVSDWKVALDGKPLFNTANSAGKARPISAAPAVVTHPLGGAMVLFGTGKLFDEGDQNTKDVESVYGVWDKARLQTGIDGRMSWVDEEVVTADRIRDNRATLILGGQYATIDASVPDWTQERGWRLPLTMLLVGGQRSILPPQMVTGLALFETMSPVLSTEEADNACRRKINTPGFNLLLDPLSGAMTRKAVVDTDRNRIINENDTAVGGWSVNDWTGRSVVLTQPPAPPCTSGNCTQTSSARGTCGPGTLRNSLQNVGADETLCVDVPGPSRWWWRELSVPDRTYEPGGA